MGRHPRVTVALMMISAGFFLIALGMFIAPHNMAPGELWATARDSASKMYDRAWYGLACAAGGAFLAAMGLAWHRLGSAKIDHYSIR